jgi:hypothetical protein
VHRTRICGNDARDRKGFAAGDGITKAAGGDELCTAAGECACLGRHVRGALPAHVWPVARSGRFDPQRHGAGTKRALWLCGQGLVDSCRRDLRLDFCVLRWRDSQFSRIRPCECWMACTSRMSVVSIGTS